MGNELSPIVTLTNEPEYLRLIAPVLALVLLTFAVLAVLGSLRVRGVRGREFPPHYFELMQAQGGARLPAAAEAASRNFVNLLELPVLFYSLVPLLAFTGRWDDTSVALLWAFVALRFTHSAIHLTVNHVPLRFLVYLASTLVLLAEWLRFGLALL